MKTIWLLLVFISVSAHAQKTENVVVVTLDGMRWQEVFGGADSALLTNAEYVHDSADMAAHFGASTAAARRQKLFPFLWSIVAQQGPVVWQQVGWQ